MNEAINMIENLILGQFDPLDFSYEFPDYLVENYEEMLSEDRKMTELLNENFPEICADFERGADEKKFISNVKKEYRFILLEK
ncbi:MAG: hypothetical protein LBQ71_14290 [Hungatella sp.]|jgi:hypothetical protein|nr:hypothetical protein [Hungatella sp.]